MSQLPIDAALAEFKPDDYTPRLVGAVFKVVPYAPALAHYRTLEDALKAVKPDATPIDLAMARGQSAQKDIQDVVWMAGVMDSIDKGYAAFTGVASVFGLVTGKKNALETDTQQRNDAVIKAIGLAYLAWNAFPGGVTEKAEHLRATPSGQALMTYYAAMEIALPFADNAVVAGTGFVDQLVDKGATAQAQRLASLAQGRSLDGAMQLLGQLTGGIQRVVDHAAKYTKPIAEAVRPYVPGALGGADAVAGIAANAADVMPVYRYLGARLAAEAACVRAIKR